MQTILTQSGCLRKKGRDRQEGLGSVLLFSSYYNVIRNIYLFRNTASKPAVIS